MLQPIPLSKPIGQDTQAPYFVEHVRRRLEQRYGYNALWRGGLKFIRRSISTCRKRPSAI